MAKKMNWMDMASWVLCTVAALHIGILGAFNYNVLEAVFGSAAKIAYIIIGLFGLPSLWHMIVMCKKK